MEHPHKIDLLVHLDLYTCKARITKLTEKWSPFSFPFQKRIVATAIQTGANIAEFRIYKLPKMTQKSMTPPVVELRGTLTGDANNQTRVTGRVEVNWVSYAFQYGVLIIVWSIVISTLLAFQFSVVLRLVLLFVILWIAFGISRIRVHQSKEHLVNALTRALSGD